MGHKKSVSEWGNTGKKTQFLNYDAFGRPVTITPPDGSAHNVTLAYTGDRVITRNVKVGTTWTGTAVAETTFGTTERYDRQGRLHELLEPSGVNNATTTTTYAYDVGNRLKSVSMPSQTRTFTYDRRGFLTREIHPETGIVDYGSYDARGHAGTKTTGVSTPTAVSLKYTFDRAERLTQVQETWPVNRTLKAWTWATVNSGSDYRNGKILYATRDNYVAIGATPFKVSFFETFTYAGRDGRVSQRVLSQYTNDGAVSESFTQTWTYDVLGNPITVGYPNCTITPCTSSPRTVTNTYSKGFLSAVSGFATALSYHPNLQLNQVTSANGAVTTYGLDPNSMARPASITTTSATPWSSGAYAYDGAGNVTRIGNGRFLYDGVSRLLEGVTVITPADSTTTRAQTAGYDLYGNIQSITTNGAVVSTPTNTANRLTSSGTFYDAAGSMTSWNWGATFQYDALGLLWHYTSGAEDWLYMCTADDQRVWAFRTAGSGNFWAIRDLDGKVLREYDANAAWSIHRDYVYRGDKLLAAVTPQGTRHFHLDHLGSVRQVTGSTTAQVAFHAFYPFGKEATSLGQADQEQMQFTGHERDRQNTTTGAGSDADDLDYMHARFYNMQLGRFTSVDPARSWDPKAPQSWNRYGYALGNPIKYSDPDGKNPLLIIGGAVVIGSLLAPDPANAPESPDTVMEPSPGALSALRQASLGVAVSQSLAFVANLPAQLGLRVPGGGLAAHEAAGGHTLAIHVGRTASDLSARLAAQPRLQTASTFFTRGIAERSVSSTPRANSEKIASFVSGSGRSLTLDHTTRSTIGLTLPRGAAAATPTNSLRVVLLRDDNLKLGYRILTAFPK